MLTVLIIQSFQKGRQDLEKIKGKVLSLLTGGGGNANYWHWMFDVLPRLYIIKDKEFTFDYYLFPDLNHKFQKETLDLLQISKKKII